MLLLLSRLILMLLLVEEECVLGLGTPLIEKGPTPLNVSVNGQATFSCVVTNADVVLWYVNDQNMDSLPGFVDTHAVEEIDNSTALRYNLSFVVYKSFETLLNNTNITCIGILFQPQFVSNESSKAELKTQGLLDSPQNITANNSADAIDLTWEPPYTLDGIRIYGYEVNVTTLNTTTTLEHRVNSTIAEVFSFPMTDRSVCTFYNSTIQARTDAGLGQPGITDVINMYEVPRKLNTSQILVQLAFTDEKIIMQFTFEQDECAGRRAEVVTAYVNYTANVTSTSIKPDATMEDDFITIVATIPKTAQGTEVTTIITLTNKKGSINSQPKLTSLSSIEKVTFMVEGSVVSLTCSFKNFSEVKGCYVVLQCAGDQSSQHTFTLSAKENLYISESGNLSCNEAECTTYNISAYDLTSDGSPGIQAWSETNKFLCPLPTSTSYLYTSLSTHSSIYATPPSSSIIPANTGSLDLIYISTYVMILLIYAFAVCVLTIIICKCCRRRRMQTDSPDKDNIKTQSIAELKHTDSTEEGSIKTQHISKDTDSTEKDNITTQSIAKELTQLEEYKVDLSSSGVQDVD